MKPEKLDFHFFTKEEIDQQFIHLKGRCTPDLHHTELMGVFHNCLVNRFVSRDTRSWAEPTVLWRISRNNFRDFDPKQKKYLSFPPREICNRQRANIHRCPVLYTSYHYMTAIEEMKGSIGVGEKFYISRWELNYSKPVTIHQLMVNNQTGQEGHAFYDPTRVYREKLSSIISEFNDLTEAQKEGGVYAVEKLGDLFASPTDEFYHITSAYAHQILYSFNGLIGGILYPSVVSKHGGGNMALSTSLVESKQVQLKEVFEVCVNEDNLNHTEPNIVLEVLRRGVFHDNDSFQNWDYLHYQFTELEVDNVRVVTYNKAVFHGKEALEKIVYPQRITIDQLIDQYIGDPEFQDSVFSRQPKTDILNTDKDILNHTEVICPPLKYLIGTPNGDSCIAYIHIPVTWEREYKTVTTPLDSQIRSLPLVTHD